MIYLNNAATTFPKPEQVANAITNSAISPPFSANRGGGESVNPIARTRQALAKLFSVSDPNRIVFTSGSTEALNLAIKGMDLSGKRVVASSTEHNSVLRPLYELEAKGIAEIDIVHCDKTGYIDPVGIQAAIRENTGLVAINHCSNVTGVVQNIAEISKIVKQSNAKLLVDASQSAGYIDIYAEEWAVDMLAFTAHKSLYGIAGTGGLYIAPELKLNPLKVGGTGTKGHLLQQPDEMPIYLEAGTPNTLGITALGIGVEFIQSIGLESIRKHKQLLMQKVYSAFENNPRINIHRNKNLDSFGVFSFTIDELSPDEIAYMLDSSFGIKVRSGLHCCALMHKDLGTYPFGTVRMSPSFYTKEEEIDSFIDALNIIINEICG